MKPKKILRTGENKEANPNTSKPGAENQEKSSFAENLKPWLLLVVAFVAVWLTREIAAWMLATADVSFLWLEIWKFIFSLAILAAISSVSRPSILGAPVIIFALMLFVWPLVIHDWPEKEKVTVKVERVEKTYPSKHIDYLRLTTGTHVFKLDAGEETPWRAFPLGVHKSGFSSENYDFTIIFKDGTAYRGDPDCTIPTKYNTFWKIKAHSPQKVYVTVL